MRIPRLVVGGILAGAALGLTGCLPGASTPADRAQETQARALSQFEAKLVGGWSRFHRYDGSYQYVLFNADRTACRWEKTASGSVTKKNSYRYWELRQVKPYSFDIYWGDSQDKVDQLYAFEYAEDKVYFGQSNLIGGHDPEIRRCFG